MNVSNRQKPQIHCKKKLFLSVSIEPLPSDGDRGVAKQFFEGETRELTRKLRNFAK